MNSDTLIFRSFVLCIYESYKLIIPNILAFVSCGIQADVHCKHGFFGPLEGGHHMGLVVRG